MKAAVEKVFPTVGVLKKMLPVLLGLPFLLLLLLGIFVPFKSQPDISFPGGGVGTANVSPEVMRWEPIIRKYATEHGLQDLVPLILALIQQESGGTKLDVMQSSESIGLPPNSITDPDLSIKIGVQHFANVYKMANGDYEITLQAYNYGTGFVKYALDRGGYSLQIARDFSREQTIKNGWSCSSWRSPEAVANRWCYGDPDYVPHVMRYYQPGTGTGGAIPGGSALGDDVFQAIMNEALKYQGYPYVFGGRSPKTSFDCSGIIEYVYRVAAGINISGTAQMQWDKTQRVTDPKPGDLIFFHSTYNAGRYITHVGIYVGNGQMYHAGDPIGYANLNTPYWQSHFAGYGRIVR